MVGIELAVSFHLADDLELSGLVCLKKINNENVLGQGLGYLSLDSVVLISRNIYLLVILVQ